MGSNKEEHMHYVALSRVRNLAGLQILALNEDKICISPLVEEEMERLRAHAPLHLCFTPISKLPDDNFRVVFHNTRSLHKHFLDLKSNHLIQGADIIGIAESKLVPSDSTDEYAITDYTVIINDQPRCSANRPPHGLLLYCHRNIHVHSQKMFTQNKFEYVIQHIDYKGNHMQIVTFYLSPACDTQSFKKFIQKIRQDIDVSIPLVLIGDTNIDFYNISNKSKIMFIEETFNCKQLISHPTTDSQTLLDHVYSNIPHTATGTIDCYWSDHKFVYVALPLQILER